MRKAEVFYKNQLAGILTQLNDASFIFEYDENWLLDENFQKIGIHFPKTTKKYFSPTLFPLFYHLLPEGNSKREICRTFKIDEKDAFGILLHSAKYDTIGALKIVEKNEN